VLKKEKVPETTPPTNEGDIFDLHAIEPKTIFTPEDYATLRNDELAASILNEDGTPVNDENALQELAQRGFPTLAHMERFSDNWREMWGKHTTLENYQQSQSIRG
jgi:hypothetical protein